VTLELFGMARALAGTSTVALDVPEPATLRQVLAALAALHPDMVGSVLRPQTFEPIEPNLVLLDGRRRCALDDVISEADRPCLLFLPSGG